MSFISRFDITKAFKEFEELVDNGDFPEQYFQELFDELYEDTQILNNLKDYIVAKKYMPNKKETNSIRIKVLFYLNKDMN